MKKVSDYLKRKYAPLRVYRDDLDEIAEIMLEFSKETTWTTEKYSYHSYDEFINHVMDKELRKLEVQSFTPYVKIDLSDFRGELTVHSDEILHQGIFSKLDQVLSPRQLKMSFLFNVKAIGPHFYYIGSLC